MHRTSQFCVREDHDIGDALWFDSSQQRPMLSFWLWSAGGGQDVLAIICNLVWECLRHLGFSIEDLCETCQTLPGATVFGCLSATRRSLGDVDLRGEPKRINIWIPFTAPISAHPVSECQSGCQEHLKLFAGFKGVPAEVIGVENWSRSVQFCDKAIGWDFELNIFFWKDFLDVFFSCSMFECLYMPCFFPSAHVATQAVDREVTYMLDRVGLEKAGKKAASRARNEAPKTPKKGRRKTFTPNNGRIFFFTTQWMEKYMETYIFFSQIKFT